MVGINNIVWICLRLSAHVPLGCREAYSEEAEPCTTEPCTTETCTTKTGKLITCSNRGRNSSCN